MHRNLEQKSTGVFEANNILGCRSQHIHGLCCSDRAGGRIVMMYLTRIKLIEVERPRTTETFGSNYREDIFLSACRDGTAERSQSFECSTHPR